MPPALRPHAERLARTALRQLAQLRQRIEAANRAAAPADEAAPADLALQRLDALAQPLGYALGVLSASGGHDLLLQRSERRGLLWMLELARVAYGTPASAPEAEAGLSPREPAPANPEPGAPRAGCLVPALSVEAGRSWRVSFGCAALALGERAPRPSESPSAHRGPPGGAGGPEPSESRRRSSDARRGAGDGYRRLGRRPRFRIGRGSRPYVALLLDSVDAPTAAAVGALLPELRLRHLGSLTVAVMPRRWFVGG